MTTQGLETGHRRISYPNLDLAKVSCALLVIIIHTYPLKTVSALSHFYLNDVLARIAVPVFFAISGFLFFRNIRFENGRIARTTDNHRRLARTVRKNLILYVVWSLVYLLLQLPQWYEIGWWGIHAVKDWLFAFLFSGSYYHLWFLLALILAVPALYLLLLFISLSRIWLITVALWVLECLTYSYAWIGIDQIPVIEFINSRMPIVFDSMFRALPLLWIGAMLSQGKHRASGSVPCIGAFLLCAAEASVLYFFSPNEDSYSYLFATPLLAYTALNALISGKQLSLSVKWQCLLRDVSLLIYCIHPMICWFCKQCGVPEGIPLWLTVTVLSVGIACLWSELKNRLPKWKKTA